MINEIQPKIKFQNIVQCTFKVYVALALQTYIPVKPADAAEDL